MKEKLNIAIEGMDAVGKKTISEMLLNYLNKSTKPKQLYAGVTASPVEPDIEKDGWIWTATEPEYHLLSFPDYDTVSGELIKDYLFTRNSVAGDLESSMRDSQLYALNRFETFVSHHPSVLRQPNPKGFIFDRYTTANMLYQTLNLNSNDKERYIRWLMDLEWNLYGLPKPDKIIVLVSTSDELIQRNIQERGRDQDFLESMEVQRKVRNNILYMVEHHGWIPIIVDRNHQMRPREEIFSDVYKAIFGGM